MEVDVEKAITRLEDEDPGTFAMATHCTWGGNEGNLSPFVL